MTKSVDPVVGSQMGIFAWLVIIVHHVSTWLGDVIDIVSALSGLGLSLAWSPRLEVAALIVASGRSTSPWATWFVVGVGAIA